MKLNGEFVMKRVCFIEQILMHCTRGRQTVTLAYL